MERAQCSKFKDKSMFPFSFTSVEDDGTFLKIDPQQFFYEEITDLSENYNTPYEATYEKCRDDCIGQEKCDYFTLKPSSINYDCLLYSFIVEKNDETVQKF